VTDAARQYLKKCRVHARNPNTVRWPLVNDEAAATPEAFVLNQDAEFAPGADAETR
jgi:hypothetical protein